MNRARPYRILTLVVFVAALCLSVAPLCFDGGGCLHGCAQHGGGSIGTHSSDVGVMGLIVLGISLVAAVALRLSGDDASERRVSARSSRVLFSAPALRTVPLRI